MYSTNQSMGGMGGMQPGMGMGGMQPGMGGGMQPGMGGGNPFGSQNPNMGM